MTELRFPDTCYRIRHAEDGDMPFVTECMRESILLSVPSSEKEHSGLWMDDILSVTSIAMEDGLMRSEVYVLTDGNEKRSGMLWMGISRDQFTCEETGYLLGLFVIPELRGKGIGKALMGCAEEWCSVNGVYSITLNVGSCNDRAVNMYEHMGFEERSAVMRRRLR